MISDSDRRTTHTCWLDPDRATSTTSRSCRCSFGSIEQENIFRHQEEHGDGMRGAIEGAYEIAKPVTFAVLTTVAAFSPLLFVPGVLGYRHDSCRNTL